MIARLRVAQLHGHELRTSAIVIALVWRSPGGKQAGVARLLRAVDVRPVDEKMGRDAGALLAKSRTDDPIDAARGSAARTLWRLPSRVAGHDPPQPTSGFQPPCTVPGAGAARRGARRRRHRVSRAPRSQMTPAVEFVRELPAARVTPA